MAQHPQPLHPTWTRSYQLYGQPHALWLTSTNGAENMARLERVLRAAAQSRSVPEVVLYAIPNRDLNQASAGGFRDWPGYLSHNRQLAARLHAFFAETAIRPRLYLEPDSIAHAVQTLRDCPQSDGARRLYRKRMGHLSQLVDLYGQAGVQVYLDAAHSGWFGYNESDIAAMAAALNHAGVARAAGIVSNVANRQRISGTPGELDYLSRLVPLLHHPHPEVIVDTSRNGGETRPREYVLAPNGSLYDNELPGGRLIGRWRRAGSGEIVLHSGSRQLTLGQLQDQQYRFDEAGMRLTAPPWLDPAGDVTPGPAPTDHTGLGVISRYRYIKPPDEADGGLGYTPGASRHDTNRQLLALQPGTPASGELLAWLHRMFDN